MFISLRKESWQRLLAHPEVNQSFLNGKFLISKLSCSIFPYRSTNSYYPTFSELCDDFQPYKLFKYFLKATKCQSTSTQSNLSSCKTSLSLIGHLFYCKTFLSLIGRLFYCKTLLSLIGHLFYCKTSLSLIGRLSYCKTSLSLIGHLFKKLC